tara:strand:+ start:211 stop:798 length:588 start_codon:yes stop_codon:yes gene_type:complete
MKIVGVTGGIASGKSTVSSYLKDNYKAYIFDADNEAKKLLKLKFVKEKIKKAFPNLKDLSTISIANEVFKNSESQKKINKIIHPIIDDLVLERINDKKDFYNLFVIDAALIIESGIFEQHQKDGAKLMLVIADEDLRLKRAISRANLTKKTIKDRLQLQMEDKKKIKYSDYIIENNSTKLDLFRKIDQIIEKIYD